MNPEPVPNSLEVREVNEHTRGYGQALGARTKARENPLCANVPVMGGFDLFHRGSR